MANKLTKGFLIILIVALLTVLGVVCIGQSDSREANATQQYELKMSGIGSGECVSAEKGAKINFYINQTVCSNFLLNITYQRVKLNAPTSANEEVIQTNGEVSNQNVEYKILDKKGTVALDDDHEPLKNTGLDKISTSEYPYYFTLETHDNCAYIFTITYLTSAGDEESRVTKYQICYYKKIDSAAPSFSRTVIPIPIWTSTSLGKRMQINFTVYDNKTKESAVSGIREVNIYEGNSSEPCINWAKETARETFSGSYLVEFNKVYYIEMIDFVGNKSDKMLFANYEETSYNAQVEADADAALIDFNNCNYAESIVSAVKNAYNDYKIVIDDVTKNDSEKKEALSKLQAALDKYVAAKEALNNGFNVNLTLEVVNQDLVEDIGLVGTDAALKTLVDIGDSVTVTLTLAQYYKSDYMRDKDVLAIASDELTNPDEMYTVTIKTVSENKSELRLDFDNEPEIRLDIGEYKRVSAVQSVYSASTGNETNLKCTVVPYADGTVGISVPYTGGIIRIFVERDNSKDLYWLFSLTAIPLLLGAAMLIYAFRKMNKIKQEALAKKQQEGEQETSITQNMVKKNPNQSKKKQERNKKINKKKK